MNRFSFEMNKIFFLFNSPLYFIPFSETGILCLECSSWWVGAGGRWCLPEQAAGWKMENALWKTNYIRILLCSTYLSLRSLFSNQTNIDAECESERGNQHLQVPLGLTLAEWCWKRGAKAASEFICDPRTIPVLHLIAILFLYVFIWVFCSTPGFHPNSRRKKPFSFSLVSSFSPSLWIHSSSRHFSFVSHSYSDRIEGKCVLDKSGRNKRSCGGLHVEMDSYLLYTITVKKCD